MALSSEVTRRIEFLFLDQDRDEASSLLESECGQNLPFLESATPHELERVQFAALKLSKGNIKKLYEAIELAQLDWRDLLLAAGFAESPRAHKDWTPWR